MIALQAGTSTSNDRREKIDHSTSKYHRILDVEKSTLKQRCEGVADVATIFRQRNNVDPTSCAHWVGYCGLNVCQTIVQLSSLFFQIFGKCKLASFRPTMDYPALQQRLIRQDKFVRWNTASDASNLYVRANQRIGPTRALYRLLGLGLGLGLVSDVSLRLIRQSDVSDALFRRNQDNFLLSLTRAVEAISRVSAFTDIRFYNTPDRLSYRWYCCTQNTLSQMMMCKSIKPTLFSTRTHWNNRTVIYQSSKWRCYSYSGPMIPPNTIAVYWGLECKNTVPVVILAALFFSTKLNFTFTCTMTYL